MTTMTTKKLIMRNRRSQRWTTGLDRVSCLVMAAIWIDTSGRVGRVGTQQKSAWHGNLALFGVGVWGNQELLDLGLTCGSWPKVVDRTPWFASIHVGHDTRHLMKFSLKIRVEMNYPTFERLNRWC